MQRVGPQTNPDPIRYPRVKRSLPGPSRPTPDKRVVVPTKNDLKINESLPWVTTPEPDESRDRATGPTWEWWDTESPSLLLLYTRPDSTPVFCTLGTVVGLKSPLRHNLGTCRGIDEDLKRVLPRITPPLEPRGSTDLSTVKDEGNSG